MKHGGVSGSFSLAGTAALIRVKYIMRGSKYKTLMLLKKIRMKKNFTFQLHNDPKNTYKSTKD